MMRKVSRFTGTLIGNLLCERALALLIFAGRIDFACLYAIARMYRHRKVISIKNS